MCYLLGVVADGLFAGAERENQEITIRASPVDAVRHLPVAHGELLHRLSDGHSGGIVAHHAAIDKLVLVSCPGFRIRGLKRDCREVRGRGRSPPAHFPQQRIRQRVFLRLRAAEKHGLRSATLGLKGDSIAGFAEVDRV